jgi:DedD protein
VVQVASLSSSERADELVAKLREAKYPAFREPVRIGGRILHRVRIGPEADRRLAEAMAAGVNKRFDFESRVVSYP